MKSKSFWQRPEGITGGLLLAGLVVGGGILLSNILPVLVSLAQNTLYLSGMLAALDAKPRVVHVHGRHALGYRTVCAD